MAPLERYQPEDIEALLNERGFDELLAEERAFVLRHLSGRAEYEAMRTLLLRTRDDSTTSRPVEADPEVRTHLVDVFRAEHRPQWRIWLNSVGAWLMPKEPAGLWRPALALGTVAAAVWFTLNSAHLTEEARPQLAEVKLKEETSHVPASNGGTITPEQAPAEAKEELEAQMEADRAPSRDEAGTVHSENSIAGKGATLATAQQPPPVSVDAVSEEQMSALLQDAPASAAADGDQVPNASDSVRDPGLLAKHEVTGNELAHNMSTAAVSEASTGAREYEARSRAAKVTTKESRNKDMAVGAPQADDGELATTGEVDPYLGLLRAAW